jgi:hypothetical protein
MAVDRAGTPPKEALAYFKAKNIKPGFAYQDVWREEHATAFTVAKAMKLDVLESIQDALHQALAEGRTFQQFRADLTPTLQQLGWWGKQVQTDPMTGEAKSVQLGSPRRLKTIYDVNTRVARAAGQWQRIQRNIKTHPILEYLLGPSEHHRVQHAAWAGTRLPADHPWWLTHATPNGYGCKCHIRAMTEAEADSLGGITDAPPVEYREWINKRTGEVDQVPVGIDPGWDYNPGQVARNEYAARVFGTKITTASAEIGSMAMHAAAEYVQAGLRSDYQRWAQTLYQHQREHSGETRLVGVIPGDVISALRQRNIQLDTAAITIRDSDLRHLARDGKHARDQHLSEAEVLALPDRLANPQAILVDQSDGSLVYVFPADNGQVAKVVVSPGYRDKARIEGQRQRINTNAIRTATKVLPSNLPAVRFEVLKGKV